MRFHVLCACLFAVLTVTASSALSHAKEGKFNTVISVGEKAPDFTAIPGIDDKKHSLREYKDAKAVVVVFTCNHCPVAVAYEDRIVALQKDYKKRGVQVVAICANPDEADKLDKLKERADSKKFNFPYLHDGDQKTGKAYGAAVTPHVFLLDKDRKISYMGAIDDNQNAEKASKHYLRDAIDASLAGKATETTETRAVGCGIKYSKESKL